VKARAFASIVAAALVLGGIAGCTFVTPIATQRIEDVTDGVTVKVGQVKLLNALIITRTGHNGNLVAQAYNESDQRITLSLQYDVNGRHTVKVKLAPHRATKIGYGATGQFLLPDIGTKPGGLLPLYVQYGSEAGKQITVPVLTNRQGEYSRLDPTATPTPTPTPTGTGVPGVTPSPTPSGSATP
jgi:hypothetical protein